MDLNSKLDFSVMGSHPEGVSQSIMKACYVVQVGSDLKVPLLVPFGSLESVVKMALSAGMSVIVDVAYNSDLCIWKHEIDHVLKKSDV